MNLESDLLNKKIKDIYLNIEKTDILFETTNKVFIYSLSPVMCYDAFFSGTSNLNAIYNKEIKEVKKIFIKSNNFDSIYVKKEAIILQTDKDSAQIEYTWVYKQKDSAHIPSLEKKETPEFIHTCKLLNEEEIKLLPNNSSFFRHVAYLNLMY